MPKLNVSEPMFKMYLPGYRTDKNQMIAHLYSNKPQENFPEILKSTLYKPRANQLVDQP